MCLQHLQLEVFKFVTACMPVTYSCMQIDAKSGGRATQEGPRKAKLQRALLVPVVAVIGLLFGAFFEASFAHATPGPLATSAGDIIKEIGRLEQHQDPKCYATASRLEDFMFGTPLSFEARADKNLRQASLLRDIWYRASNASEVEATGPLSAADIEAAAAAIIQTDRDSTGHWRVKLQGFEPIRINETDKRQYSSITYSLRA